MKKLVYGLLIFMLLFGAVPVVEAHSGRTDSNGGHNCSQKSINKGLCTGYHYHNGGGSSSGSDSSSGSTSKPSTGSKAPAKPALITATVYINGVKQNFTQSAYVKDGTTLVPMRPIFEALGATVQWESSTQKVTGTKGKTKVVLTVGNKKGYVNENGITRSVALSHSSEIRNGSTMVPLRFISESLGASVKWNQDTRTVTITQ